MSQFYHGLRRALDVGRAIVFDELQRHKRDMGESARHGRIIGTNGGGSDPVKRHLSRLRWAIMLPALILLLGAGLNTPSRASVSATMATPSSDCLGPVAGQSIYDCAHVLTPAEIATLEKDAAAVVQAGAPTVVYLQARNANADQTLQDAIDLMNRWNVESRAGAHDGFVMFFNLQPGNLRHGQVALYAGEKYHKGNLPTAELTRIRTDVMTPLLANDETAQGIAAGLPMVAHDLRYGPPPPPAYQVVAGTIARIPFNLLAALFAGLVGFLYLRLRRQPPVSSQISDIGMGALTVPGELAPAMAGALLKGRVSDAHMEATILDFARRGLLAFAPEGAKKVRLELLGISENGKDGKDGKDLTGYELDLWNALSAHADSHADSQYHVVFGDALTDVRKSWGPAKYELRRELIERGWYDPLGASARRRRLYIAGGVGMAGVALSVLLILLSREGWAAIALTLFLAAGTLAFIWGYMVPDTTVEGEIAAAQWRGYAASVSDRAYEPNLDTDLPYIVALGLTGKLAPRLKAVSERGYSPSWFRAGEGREGEMRPATGFYPYWMVFHTSMAPASSGSATGGYSGGGAASGGGGSAGSF